MDPPEFLLPAYPEFGNFRYGSFTCLWLGARQGVRAPPRLGRSGPAQSPRPPRRPAPPPLVCTRHLIRSRPVRRSPARHPEGRHRRNHPQSFTLPIRQHSEVRSYCYNATHGGGSELLTEIGSARGGGVLSIRIQQTPVCETRGRGFAIQVRTGCFKPGVRHGHGSALPRAARAWTRRRARGGGRQLGYPWFPPASRRFPVAGLTRCWCVRRRRLAAKAEDAVAQRRAPPEPPPSAHPPSTHRNTTCIIRYHQLVIEVLGKRRWGE